MSAKDAFADLKRSKEDEYFHLRERQVLDRLRRERDIESERDHMATVLGIRDDEALRRLQGLGFSRETVLLVYVVPLVHVAWAESMVTRRERNLIFDMARQYGLNEGDPAYRQLGEWLDARPDEAFFEEARLALKALLEAMPAATRQATARQLFVDCTRVAEASGGVLGFVKAGRAVCPEEHELLERLAADLGHSELAEKGKTP